MATGRSSTYSRPTSSARPMPPVGNVSSVTRSIQSGTMNISSTNLRQRPNSAVRQTSTNIPETNSETTRSRLASHNRSVRWKNEMNMDDWNRVFRIQPMKNHHLPYDCKMEG